MKRIAARGLGDDPLAASLAFNTEYLPRVLALLDQGAHVLVELDLADHRHGEWRGAVAAMLARSHAPQRLNIAAGAGEALEAIAAYLAEAPGVTGQYLAASENFAAD